MTSNADYQTQKPMPKPSNDIDMQAMTTFPHISSDYMSDRVRNKFRSFSYVTDEQGNHLKNKDGSPKIQLTKDLWAVMELFTQDFRLGNLNKEESFFVRYNIDLCSDIMIALPDSFSKSALICFERSVCASEVSQSKGGFLRRLFNTFYTHNSVKEESPMKRNFFGLGKKTKSED